jgi:virginiamycin B lyase
MKRHSCLTLLFLPLLVCLVAACGNATTSPSSTGGPLTPSPAQNQPAPPAHMAIGRFQEFALPQNNSGLMRPAADSQGRLWFGEMNRNYLGSFDPHTGKFWQQTPPHGKWGIMGIAAAPDDTIWFAEQYADYIGRYNPQNGQYTIYQLPTIHAPDPSDASKTQSLPSAPNDVVLDRRGNLWFTELNANAIGSLNTSTGSIHQYPLTSAKNARALDPYGIAVDPQGNIWFTEASTSRLGRLNPATGQISSFTPPGVTSPLMEITSDARGQIWATTFDTGQLLHFDPGHASFTIYNAPTPLGNAGGLYGLTVASNGDIWIAVSAENILARLDSRTRSFSYYSIPTKGSLPIGLVEGKDQAIWFTESGSNKIGRLQP